VPQKHGGSTAESANLLGLMTERSTWIHTSTMIATPSLVCVISSSSASNFLKAIATPIVEVITPRTWPCKKIKERTTTM